MFDTDDYTDDYGNADIDEDDEPVKNGSLCRHWNAPADCDIRCSSCGHECHQHNELDDGNNCRECNCLDWVEE